MAAGILHFEFKGNHSCKGARMRVWDFLFFLRQSNRWKQTSSILGNKGVIAAVKYVSGVPSAFLWFMTVHCFNTGILSWRYIHIFKIFFCLYCRLVLNIIKCWDFWANDSAAPHAELKVALTAKHLLGLEKIFCHVK